MVADDCDDVAGMTSFEDFFSDMIGHCSSLLSLLLLGTGVWPLDLS